MWYNITDTYRVQNLNWSQLIIIIRDASSISEKDRSRSQPKTDIKAKIYGVSSDTHQLQYIPPYHFTI